MSMPSLQNFSKKEVLYSKIKMKYHKTSHYKLSDTHQLECWTCDLTLMMHIIATMKLVTHYFWLTLLLVNM